MTPFSRVLGFLLILVTCSLAPVELSAATLVYRLKVGSKYQFDVEVKGTAEVKAFDIKESSRQDEKYLVTVTVISFRSGLYVLDVVAGERHYRRYLKPDGRIYLAPNEKESALPFIFPYPASDWEDGKTYVIQTNIVQEGKSYPAKFEMASAKKSDKDSKIINITGGVALPGNQAIKRNLNLKGKLTLHSGMGFPDSGTFTIDYQLNYGNKEMAVVRPLWGYSESRSVSFQLKGVDQ